jgi:hypothetical protein
MVLGAASMQQRTARKRIVTIPPRCYPGPASLSTNALAEPAAAAEKITTDELADEPATSKSAWRRAGAVIAETTCDALRRRTIGPSL